jgi:hypothetical protein
MKADFINALSRLSNQIAVAPGTSETLRHPLPDASKREAIQMEDILSIYNEL